MGSHDESHFFPRTLPRICDECEYRGCDPCPIGANERQCEIEYNNGCFSWMCYKDECLEALEDKMKEEPMSACDVLECKYRGGETGCKLLADPHECGVISGEYNRDEWEAHIAHRRDVLLKNADELRAEGVVR